MNYSYKKVHFGPSLLIFTLVSTTFFCYWLFTESDDEKLHRVYLQFDRLRLEGRQTEADKLFDETLSSTGDGPLDPIYTPLIRAKSNGYQRLEYYERILAGDPGREATYKEIETILSFVPDKYVVEIRTKYLAALANIPEVRQDFLRKYNLQLNDSTLGSGQ